jgi:tetratricopeptide (TPR) repeat protein
MSKKKKSNQKNFPNRPFATPTDQRHQGLKAFESGHFEVAIARWTNLAQQDPKIKTALAEAYFRRALNNPLPDGAITDLEQAIKLAPEDWRYQYHLGLNLHRSGKLNEAIVIYRRLLEQRPNLTGVGLALGLASLAQNPAVELNRLPGSTPATVAALSPVQALLQTRPLDAPSATNEPLPRLWYGLSLLQGGKADKAREWLEAGQPLASRAATIRLYYQGLAAFQTGDRAGALKSWRKAFENNRALPWLRQNLAALLLEQLNSADESQPVEEIAPYELLTALVKVNSELDEKMLEVFDRQAFAAAEKGDWATASRLWTEMREIISLSGAKAGSPRTVLHNLALAYEAQERWEEAAEVWRAMLRTRPRQSPTAKTSLEASGYSETQWLWVRRRIIECYKQAGQPEQAVTVFRQAIKAEPNDIELRLQLVEALIANEQVQAAFNELNRIIQLDPDNVEAELKMAALEDENGMWGADTARLRRLLEKHPERADVRTHLIQSLLKHGQEWHDNGGLHNAQEFFEEARRLDPTDYKIPLYLARIAIDRAAPKEAQALMDETLRLGEKQPEAYALVFDCWVALDKLEEARQLLNRAEAILSPTPEWYIDLAANILRRKARGEEEALSPLEQILGRFGPPPNKPKKPAKPAKPAENPWEQFAITLLNQATALKPGDAPTQTLVGTATMMYRPDLALPYLQEAVRLAPDDPRYQLTLGIALGLNEQGREAKEVLTRAAKQARKQGNVALADQIENIRREVDSPLFRMLTQLGPLADLLDEGEDDFDGPDFDFFD